MDETKLFLEIFRDVLALRKVWDYTFSLSGHPLEPYVIAANDMFRLLYGHNFKGMDHEDIHRILSESTDAAEKARQMQRQEEPSVSEEPVLCEPKKRSSWLSWLDS